LPISDLQTFVLSKTTLPSSVRFKRNWTKSVNRTKSSWIKNLPRLKQPKRNSARHAEEARLAKVASDEQAERLAGEYKQQLAEMEARMREENNEAIRQQME
jgi:hypothetical protein